MSTYTPSDEQRRLLGLIIVQASNLLCVPQWTTESWTVAQADTAIGYIDTMLGEMRDALIPPTVDNDKESQR